MPTSSSSSSSSGASTGVGTGTTSGTDAAASGGPTSGTQHVDVPGIESAANRFIGITENLGAVRTRMNELSQQVPTKGGPDNTWSTFAAGGYGKGTRDLTDAVYAVGQLVQGLHDGLISAARTLQQGEDDNTGATTRLKDSMTSIEAGHGAGPVSERGVPTESLRRVSAAPAAAADRVQGAPERAARVDQLQRVPERAAGVDGRAGDTTP